MRSIVMLFVGAIVAFAQSEKPKWREIPIQPLVDATKGDDSPDALFFLNEKVGWVATSYRILHTKDGGQTWELQLFLEDVKEGRFYAIWFLDEKRGWAVRAGRGPTKSGQTNVWKTIDGGKTWQKDPFFADLRGIYKILQFRGETGWLSGTIMSKGVLRTKDGGTTWKPINTRGHRLFFITSSVGYVVKGQEVFKTTDAGDTWTTIDLTGVLFKPNEVEFMDVYFINENEGWVSARYLTKGRSNRDSVIIHTKDGGITWEKIGEQSLKNKGTPCEIRFVDNKHGWLIMQSPPNKGSRRIFATNDGGRTWKMQLEKDWIVGMQFFDKDTGYAVGPSKVLLKYSKDKKD